MLYNGFGVCKGAGGGCDVEGISRSNNIAMARIMCLCAIGLNDSMGQTLVMDESEMLNSTSFVLFFFECSHMSIEINIFFIKFHAFFHMLYLSKLKL
jgi:hypothetical protein